MINKKSKIITILTVAAISSLMIIAAGRVKAHQSSTQKPYRTKEFSISTPGQLKVRTSGGYIKVVGTEGNRVRVEMYVSKDGKNLNPSDIKLEHYDIQIKKEDNTIIASAKRRNSSWWKFWKHHNISISFVVYTPQKMNTNLNTSGGHIIASGLTGNQNIRTSGGYLKLVDLHGTIKARTSGGRIKLSNSSGNIKIRTSGGRINISNVSGKLTARTSGGRISARNTNGQIHLHTSGGNIRLKNVVGSLEASTSGGSIFASFTQVKHSVQLRTSGGNIKITVPGNIGLNLDLRGSEVHIKLRNFSGSVKHNSVEGTINGGGPELSAHTSGGIVRISYR